MKGNRRPPPDVAVAARSLVKALEDLNLSDERVIARDVFWADDGAEWEYALVQFPSVASARRRGHDTPPAEWHVYEADEPWDELDFTQGVWQWVKHPSSTRAMRDEGQMWATVVLALLAALEVVGEAVKDEPEPFVGVYPTPTGPLTETTLTLVFKWSNNGRTVFVSEDPATFLPGAAEFHESWRAPTVSIKAAGRRFL